MLARGQASSTCVAQALGLSVRTMQRWLGASGLAFSTLVNKVRTELVQRHLDSPATPCGDLADAELQRAECIHEVVQWAVWDGAAKVERARGIDKK